MMTTKIRQAVNSDSPALKNMIFDIWKNEYQFDVHEKDYPDLTLIEKYYSQHEGLFLVAIDEQSNIIGSIAYQCLSPNDFVLKRMFVKKSHRGKGVAQNLLSKLLNYIQEDESNTGKIILYLSTKEDQAIAAKYFYLKNNFKIISKGMIPNGFPFFYEDDLFMAKEINC